MNQMRHQPFPVIYHFCCSIRLTIVLLLLLVVDLCFGYLCLQGNVSLFQPMNEIGLWQWLMTYGRTQPLLSAWFFFLLPLLFLLVINTLFCTGDKLYHLFSSQLKKLPSTKLGLTLSIHLMHLAMVLLLTGYLISYTFSTIHPSITLMPGITTTIPGSSYTIELTTMQMIPYTGNRLPSFSGRNLNTKAHLHLTDGKKQRSATLSINRPVHFRGFSLFLQRFNPGTTGGMSSSQYIVLDIRRDPGVIPTFTGMAAFITGLAGYLIFRYLTRKNRSF